MARGLPIVVSVTRLDAAFYGKDPLPGDAYELHGPARDAAAVESNIFAARRASHQPLLPTWRISSDAGPGRHAPSTREGLLCALDDAAAALDGPGDILFLYYAGHGSRLPDGVVGAGERDVLCLTDGFVLDVELAVRWQRFRPDVRIVMVADCCHARDVAREVAPVGIARVRRAVARLLRRGRREPWPYRSLPDDRAREVAARWRPRLAQWYDDAVATGGGGADAMPQALLLLSACDERQLASTTNGESVYLAALLRVWASAGATIPSYQRLADRVARTSWRRSPAFV